MAEGMKDIRKKTDLELHNLLFEKGEALRSFRFALAGSRTRNVKEGRALKKERARIATELAERNRRASL